MKAMVTGGAGFIGSHLVDELINRGYEVHILDNLISGSMRNIHSMATFHPIDICSNEARQVITKERPDVVFHLAAQADVSKSLSDPNFDASVNINGTINILEACKQANVKKFIFASTSAVYGELRMDLIPEKVLTIPISYYGASKLSAETYIRLYYQLYKLPYTILRYGNVYGPRQLAKGEGGVVAIFLDRIKRGEPFTVFGDGEQTRDFIFVKDIVLANIASIDHGDQQTFNIGTSRRTSINQLIEYFTEIHGSTIDVKRVNVKKGDIKHSCLDNSSARNLLEWEPVYDVYQGLEESYSYIDN